MNRANCVLGGKPVRVQALVAALLVGRGACGLEEYEQLTFHALQVKFITECSKPAD